MAPDKCPEISSNAKKRRYITKLFCTTERSFLYRMWRKKSKTLRILLGLMIRSLCVDDCKRNVQREPGNKIKLPQSAIVCTYNITIIIVCQPTSPITLISKQRIPCILSTYQSNGFHSGVRCRRHLSLNLINNVFLYCDLF